MSRSGRGWLGGALLAVAAAGGLAGVYAAWFARQRYFEWMFAPLANPQFARAAVAGWVNEQDMVLAVSLNGDAVAYPVRQLAYHHLVQDSVGGVPIVATY